ncbi:MAG: hypothetical protein KAU31_05660 [Spirochaetaceae bacterium]|nr:hypothetical protein [Spirochaetaceae bacterium]
MSKLHNNSDRIKVELLELASELNAITPLLDKLFTTAPDEVEIRAMAASLHAFYTGIERIFVMVEKGTATSLPSSTRWHQELLEQMATPSANRPALIEPWLKDELADFLAFRHFFRHSYPMQLNWELLKPLFKRLNLVWKKFEAQITKFLSDQDSD